jgi:hypothetical protein
MTAEKLKVKELADKMYNLGAHQIIIDFVQEIVEELLNDDDITPDKIGAAAYDCGILTEVYNPKFEEEVEYLDMLYIALNKWNEAASSVNRLLGIDPNS